MRLHIKVTEEDIRLGKPKDSEACPIACAFRRVLSEEIFPGRNIDLIDCHVEGSGKEMYYYTVDGAKMICTTDCEIVDAFIDKFDKGQPVLVFEADFEFEEDEDYDYE